MTFLKLKYKEQGDMRYLKGGEGIRSNVKGGHLHILEESVEMI